LIQTNYKLENGAYEALTLLSLHRRFTLKCISFDSATILNVTLSWRNLIGTKFRGLDK